MNRGVFLSSLPLVLLAAPATAQITFNTSLVEDLVGRHVQTSVYLVDAQNYPEVQAIANAAGGNQTYDFSTFVYDPGTAVGYDVWPSSAGTPGEGDPDFDGANWVQVQAVGDGFYVYSDLRSDGFFLLGSIYVQGTNQSISKNDPPDETYGFPLTEGSTWEETFIATTEGFGTTSQTTITNDEFVDGWGELITPAGSASALRLRKTHTAESSGTPLYSTTSYIFITNEGMGASIIFDDQGTILSASYSITNTTATLVEETPVHSFHLDQNYPNPFSTSTTLAFTMEQPGHATLRVFDLMGREVARLVDEYLPTGSYRRAFHGDHLSSGVYIYQLQLNNARSLRQLVLRK